MATTDAQKKANAKYKAEHYRQIPIRFKNDYYDNVLKPFCDENQIPVQTFIKEAIQNEIDRRQNK